MAPVQPELRYQARRSELQEYFDCTALENWKQLTSNSPLGRIRQSVRDGRDTMRALLLAKLPADMTGSRMLDAGCGTGALAWAAAARGAQVVAVDLSPNLLELAATRQKGSWSEQTTSGGVTFASGDMLSDQWGQFDHTVCMDSLIHYQLEDTLDAIVRLASRSAQSLQFTVAPASRPLLLLHRLGQMLPRQNRSPDIHPLLVSQLTEALAGRLGPNGWKITNCQRVSSGFYKSQAIQLTR